MKYKVGQYIKFRHLQFGTTDYYGRIEAIFEGQSSPWTTEMMSWQPPILEIETGFIEVERYEIEILDIDEMQYKLLKP